LRQSPDIKDLIWCQEEEIVVYRLLNPTWPDDSTRPTTRSDGYRTRVFWYTGMNVYFEICNVFFLFSCIPMIWRT